MPTCSHCELLLRSFYGKDSKAKERHSSCVIVLPITVYGLWS